MPVSKNKRKKEREKKQKAKNRAKKRNANVTNNSTSHKDINEVVTSSLENISQNFDETLQDETNKNNPNSTLNSSNSASVKKHRERLKKLGFKQVSIYLAPDIYEKLKYLKLHTNKSYADIISYWVEKEYSSFKKRRDIPIIPYEELL